MASPAQVALAGFVVLAVVLCKKLYEKLFTSRLPNIAGPPSHSWLKGSMGALNDANAWSFHASVYQRFGGAAKVHSVLNKEILYVSDPLALHHIVVKEQDVYEETPEFILLNRLIFGESLFSSVGAQHKRQRKMLNPVFSMKHMRDILTMFYPCTREMLSTLTKQCREAGGSKEIDVMRWLTRVALEYIGRGGLGHSFGPLEDETPSEHEKTLKRLGPLLVRAGFGMALLPLVANIGTPSFRRKVAESLPIPLLKEMINCVDILQRESEKIVNEKKMALEKGEEGVQALVSQGKDIMSVLLKANMQASSEDRLPEAELYGQVNTFIFAGQDTTSHGLSRIIHQLVKRPDVQQRLRKEIIAARAENNGDEFDYDTLMNLPYLDAVCRETLRLFPPVPNVIRKARADTVLPLMTPVLGADGTTKISEIPIRKGTHITISILGANRNPNVWGEDVEEWKPERWLSPLPPSVSDAKVPGVYSSLMTFIGGGRACIGFKFSEMEMKLVLSTLVEKLVFEPGSHPITWAMPGITRPTVPELGDMRTQMPLKVSLYEP